MPWIRKPVPDPFVVAGIAPPAPGSPTLPDGTLLPQRSATKIETVESVPAATNVTVPTANPTGAVPTKSNDASTAAPIVAVNTTSKWKDPGFLLGVVTSLTGLVTSIVDLLPASGPIDWRAMWPKLMLAILGAAAAYIRTLMNTVTK